MKKFQEKIKKLFVLMSAFSFAGCTKAQPAGPAAAQTADQAEMSASQSTLTYVKDLPGIMDMGAPVSRSGIFFASSNDGTALTFDESGNPVLPEGYSDIILSANHRGVYEKGYVWADASKGGMTYELEDGKIISQTQGVGLGGFMPPIGYDSDTGQVVQASYDNGRQAMIYQPIPQDSLDMIMEGDLSGRIYFLEGHQTGTEAGLPADDTYVWNLETGTFEPYEEPADWKADRGPAITLYMTLNNGLQTTSVYPRMQDGQMYIVNGSAVYGPYDAAKETGSGEAVAWKGKEVWLLSPGQAPLLLPAGTQMASGRIGNSVLIEKDGKWALYSA